jgi:hypothetical protein
MNSNSSKQLEKKIKYVAPSVLKENVDVNSAVKITVCKD